MPNFCLVVKCGNNGLRDSVGFYRIPSLYDNNKKKNSLAEERRAAWIKSLRREDLTDTKLKNGRICSKHFISGKPAKFNEKNNPDWVPSINMGYESTNLSKESTGVRYNRLLKTTSQVCSRHFTNDDFIVGGNIKKLKKCAIPRIIRLEPSCSYTLDLPSASSTKQMKQCSASVIGPRDGAIRILDIDKYLKVATAVTCWASDCNHNNMSDSCKFFRFPTEKNILKSWLIFFRRDVEPGSGARVCSCHFRKGRKENLPQIYEPNKRKSSQEHYPSSEKKRKKTRLILPKSESVPSTSTADNEIIPEDVAVDVPTVGLSQKPVSNQGEKKPPAAKEKLRSALKAALTADNFDPLDLDNLLLSTASVFQEMCKELELSAMMNQQVDHLNVDKARITLTSAGGGEQALQIVNLNQIPEDPTPSFSESTNDLERMLTDAEKDLMSAEEDYPGTMGTRTMSTQTDDRSLEMENKKLKLENAALKNQILRLQSQIKLQDVSKLLVVCDDE